MPNLVDFWTQHAPPQGGPAGPAPPQGGLPGAAFRLATVAKAHMDPSGQGPSGSSTDLGEFTANMTPDQVRALANQYISAGGVQNTDNGEYWVNAWNQFGKKDPAYFLSRLKQGIGDQPGYNQKWGAQSTPGAAGGGGGGGLAGPFQAPTELTMANDPGFQARLKMGTDALQASAAAKGSILSGGTLKALDRYAQDYASNEYGNVYGRAYGQFSDKMNWQQRMADRGLAAAQGAYRPPPGM